MNTPALWYFDQLNFLKDQNIPRTPRETFDDEEVVPALIDQEVCEKFNI